jgi:crotonobetainyl-CoA:carnitine CoA-transferase CaiB-like acyl-CoA transferase
VVLPPLMAAAAIAALDARRRTGVGRHIDASMYEVCAQQMRDAIIAAQTGPRPRRDGNRDPAVLHQGVYPTQGEDRWIAIECADAAAWSRFGAAAGISWPAPGQGGDERKDDLDAAIAAWTRQHDGRELMRRLQGAGVPAGVVQDASEIIADPQLSERGFLQMLDHLKLGAFEHQATPISLSRSRRAMFPAPALGQHTEHVCREVLGMSEQQFAALAAANVFE